MIEEPCTFQSNPGTVAPMVDGGWSPVPWESVPCRFLAPLNLMTIPLMCAKHPTFGICGQGNFVSGSDETYCGKSLFKKKCENVHCQENVKLTNFMVNL